MKQLDDLTIDNATHELMCTHSFSSISKKNYTMPCIPLNDMPGGERVRVLVFGERYWKNKGHIKKIRYVKKSKVRSVT